MALVGIRLVSLSSCGVWFGGHVIVSIPHHKWLKLRQSLRGHFALTKHWRWKGNFEISFTVVIMTLVGVSGNWTMFWLCCVSFRSSDCSWVVECSWRYSGCAEGRSKSRTTFFFPLPKIHVMVLHLYCVMVLHLYSAFSTWIYSNALYNASS